MSRHTIKRTTVRLPAALLRTAQRKAAAEGRTLTELMEEGLRYVVSEKPKQKRERIIPRVSSATGGLAPGVDITSFSAIEEQDDIEEYGRTKQSK